MTLVLLSVLGGLGLGLAAAALTTAWFLETVSRNLPPPASGAARPDDGRVPG